MSTMAVIGERVLVEGYGLAGAEVHVAEQPQEILDAWRALPAQVAVVVLTKASAAVLEPEWLSGGGERLVAVLP